MRNAQSNKVTVIFMDKGLHNVRDSAATYKEQAAVEQLTDRVDNNALRGIPGSAKALLASSLMLWIVFKMP